MTSLADPELSASHFDWIANAVYTHAGIRMRAGKEGLVRARLAKRLRTLSMPGYGEYIEHVMDDASGREFDAMIDALTTNKTSFLRESSHFDYLRDVVLPQLTTLPRIWSAGCSTGEEAYTLAMLLLDHQPDFARSGGCVVATDISERVLATARAGTYATEHMGDVPQAWLKKYWSTSDTRCEVLPAMRSAVRFARLNLMDAWPMRGPFDAIFCRNVMIYFDKPTQQRLIDRFWALLAPGGHLFVGHSESLGGLTHRFRRVQAAAYVKG